MRSHDDLLFLLELAEWMLALTCSCAAVIVFVYGAPQARAATPLLGFVVTTLAWLVTFRLGARWHSRHR